MQNMQKHEKPQVVAPSPGSEKENHALTREQCSLCTANRPRLCDQHYKQGADELLKHVTAAIQDQQTPGGVKATYEQLLELCNQQRQALTQQAQEVERLKLKEAELGELKLRLNCPMLAPSCLVCGQVKPFAIRHIEAHAIGVCGECRSASQQLAAMTAERDEACGELLVSLDDAPIGSLAGKLVTANRVLRSHLATLQATLAEREELVEGLKTELEEYRSLAEKLGAEKAISERDIARQDAARLRELLALSKCGTCDGSGWYQDTDPMTGRPVQAQCRYCFNKSSGR